jgi:hypothetical protein
MQILIKFPTRSRPEKFLQVLNTYVDLLEEPENTKFLITCDDDDLTMNNPELLGKLEKFIQNNNLQIKFGKNRNKIEAVNSDVDSCEFDILLLASDDMIPQQFGYDTIIRQNFKKFFPDTDGVLWFNDGYQEDRLNTLCILGKKYYDRFGYIYHKSYVSLWCDTEFTEVSKMLNKVKYIPHTIIKHEHPVWLGQEWDDLQKKNDSFNNTDMNNFLKRKKNNFDLKQD